MSDIEKLIQQKKDSRLQPLPHVVLKVPISIAQAKVRVSKVTMYNRLVKLGVIIRRLVA